MPAAGPTTEAGKAASSRNAVKHGILSETPLVTPLETAEDWQSHLAAVRQNLAPRDHLEACLAERVALLLWRMRRLACAEVDAIAWSQERVVNDYPKEEFNGDNPLPVHEYAKRFREAEKRRDLWTSVWETPEGDWLDNTTAVEVLKQAISLCGGSCEHAPPGLRPYGDWTKEVWTAGRLRTCLDWVVTHRQVDAEKFRSRCLAYFEDRVKKLEAALEEVEQDLERMARRRMLPPEEEMQRQTRYEAHLGRELSRTMKSLRDLQLRPLELGQSTISTLQSSISNGGHREDRPLDGSTPFQPEAENYETNSVPTQEPSGTPTLQLSMTPVGAAPASSHEPVSAPNSENCETNPTPALESSGTPLLHDSNTPAGPTQTAGHEVASIAPALENYETNSPLVSEPSGTPLLHDSNTPAGLPEAVDQNSPSAESEQDPSGTPLLHDSNTPAGLPEAVDQNSPSAESEQEPSGTPLLQDSITPADLAEPIAQQAPTTGTSPRELTWEEIDASFYPPAPTAEQLEGLDTAQLARLGTECMRLYRQNKQRYLESHPGPKPVK